jgi:branched-chain amino acid transport system ATP-binding protein
MSLLIVEQNTAKALDIADYVTVVESGKKVWEGTAEEAKNDSSLIDAFMGIKNE